MIIRILLLLIASTVPALAADSSSASSPAAADGVGTVLITGSDRGIGLQFVREFHRRGWRVIATCRNPHDATELNQIAAAHPEVSVERLDVTDSSAIDQLAAKLGGRPIDVLINNAGVSGSFEGQSLAKLDAGEFDRVLRVNSYAPLRVSSAFLELVAASRQRKVIGISSGYGSLASVERIAGSGYPTAYFYAMSKAALNMGLRQFALETAPRGITTVLLSPGAVDTDMQRDLRAHMARLGKPIATPALSAAESVQSMVTTIEQLKPDQNGKFLARDGTPLPW